MLDAKVSSKSSKSSKMHSPKPTGEVQPISANLMTFEEAVEELKKGARIRRKSWEPYTHFAIKGEVVRGYRGEVGNFDKSADIILSHGWHVLGDPSVELTFLEAVRQLRAKQKITHKDWVERKEDKFLFVDANSIVICRAVEFDFMPTYHDMQSNDWEVLH